MRNTSAETNLDIHSWMEDFVQELQRQFGYRLIFAGLQGSRGRGEGRADSDIDLDALHYRFELRERVKIPRPEVKMQKMDYDEEVRVYGQS